MTPCEEWGGARTSDGYGSLYIDKIDGKQKNMMPHRLIWMQHHGHTNLLIIHECDNPPCINMAHLRAGTNQDNTDDKMKRGRHHESKKTHCFEGHEFTEANTYMNRSGARSCRACNRKRDRERRSK